MYTPTESPNRNKKKKEEDKLYNQSLTLGLCIVGMVVMALLASIISLN
jgi:hypothetical protein